MAKAIVALGNPGPGYARTRHNAGWILADHLASRWQFGDFRRNGVSQVVSGTLRGVPVRLLKPQTYMNLSGAALPALRSPSFHPSRDLLVLADDVALPAGSYRIRARGSAGGHNGLKSIEAALGDQEYARLRIGIGARPDEVEELSDWVLGRFSPDERTVLDGMLDDMSDAVECWLADGVERAMNRFNH